MGGTSGVVAHRPVCRLGSMGILSLESTRGVLSLLTVAAMCFSEPRPDLSPMQNLGDSHKALAWCVWHQPSAVGVFAASLFKETDVGSPGGVITTGLLAARKGGHSLLATVWQILLGLILQAPS